MNKFIKCGELKYLNVNCSDIDQMWVRKLLRYLKPFFGGFDINYTPSLKGYDRLYLTDDQTIGNRLLIQQAKKMGVETFVVQHGFPTHRYGFTPLRADYLICWPECRDIFIKWGIDPKRLISDYRLYPEAPKAKFIEGIESVLFLVPPRLWANPVEFYENYNEMYFTENDLIDIAQKVKSLDPLVIVKPHPKSPRDFKDRVEASFKVSYAKADDLIFSAKKVYSFTHCTTHKDAEVFTTPVIGIDRSWLFSTATILQSKPHRNFDLRKDGYNWILQEGDKLILTTGDEAIAKLIFNTLENTFRNTQ